MATITRNAAGLSVTLNADGFEIAGGTTPRAVSVTGGDVDMVGSGSAAITFPTASGTLATLTMEENTPFTFDSALSADGKYSGFVRAGTAGAALAFGDLVYLAAADSRWELADADAAATAGDITLGICVLAAAGDGSATTILLFGIARADTAFPTLTVSAPVYVGTTAGDIVTTAPTGADDVHRRIGFGLTGDELFFAPFFSSVVHV